MSRPRRSYRIVFPVVGLLLLAAPTMEQTPSISGRILDDRGNPVAALTVELQSQYGTSLYPKVSTRTNADGHYSLAELGPGTWRIRAYRSGENPSTTLLTGKIELDEGREIIDVELPYDDGKAPNIQPGIRYFHASPVDRTEPTPQLEGALIDVQTLEPIQGGTITLYKDLDGEEPELVATTQSDENGSFRFNGLEPGIHRFSISKPGYHDPWENAVMVSSTMRAKVYMLNIWTAYAEWMGNQSQKAKAWQNGKPMEVVLSPFRRPAWGSLSGRLQLADPGSRDITVELVDLKGRPLHRFLDARVKDDGTFTIYSIAPALYTLRITVGDESTDVPNVNIEAGTNDISLTL